MNAAIIGYGKSGEAARKLLLKRGYTVIDIFDDNKSLNFKPIAEYHNAHLLTIVSPGIDRAKYPNIPDKITSEIELAFEEMSENARIIAITGTNGKSTTTHLAAQILCNLGVKAIACGNIGLPFAEAVCDKSIEVFVVELSSFQIDILNHFRADSACIANVTQDHLDRYNSMDNYYEAKLKLLSFIKLDGLLVADTDKKIINRALLYFFHAQYIDTSFEKYPKLDGTILNFNGFSVDISAFRLFGVHNILNLSFALALVSGVHPLKGDLTDVIKNLTGMPHRTELILVRNGVSWVNDSKGTNVDSVITALKSMRKPSYLLLGGRDKHSDYRVLADIINKNVSMVCYFGEAATLIHSQLSLLLNVDQELFDTLESAVEFCAEVAAPGSTVMLSPACTSFDEFKNYEDRGLKFAQYAQKYSGGNS